VELGLDINKEGNSNGWIMLFNACDKGYLPMVKYLVEQGTYINKQTKNGFTLLFNACKTGNLSLVKYLV